MSNKELYNKRKEEISQDISSFATKNGYSMGEEGIIIKDIEQIADNVQPISDTDKILANGLRHDFDEYCSQDGRMRMQDEKTQELGRIFSKLTEYITPERQALINNAINGGIRQTNIGISKQHQFPEGEAARWGVQNKMFKDIMKIMTDNNFSNLKSLETRAIVGEIDELVHNNSPMSNEEIVSIKHRLSSNLYNLLEPDPNPGPGFVTTSQAMVNQMVKVFVAGAKNSTLEIQKLIEDGLTDGLTALGFQPNKAMQNPPDIPSTSANLGSNMTISSNNNRFINTPSPIIKDTDKIPQINYSTNKPTTGIFTRLGNIGKRIWGTVQEHPVRSLLIAGGAVGAVVLCAIFAPPLAVPLAGALVGVGVGKFAYDEYKNNPMPGEHKLGENLPQSGSPQLQSSRGPALSQGNNSVVNNPSVTPNPTSSLEAQNRTFGDLNKKLSYAEQNFSIPTPPPTPSPTNKNSLSQSGGKSGNKR
ncbi:hypothetical protein [Candidatus Tisiphia endosymbiont of Nemotelus uliginosus]|uniref:hypothetical protein n=1 Tax=Candidatus Tisiphia endosymbiont of Nemotelus uliginosus TaxID=3077926 RepID=UPI0035C935D9